MNRAEGRATPVVEVCDSLDEATVAMIGAAGLPTEDLGSPGQLFKVVRDGTGNGPAAIGGLEMHPPYGLLRSCVVRADRRKEGLARAIVLDLLVEARARGLRQVFLLTETAAPYFEQFGFARVERDALPAEIAASEQAASLCPASAVTMRCDL